MSKGGTRRKGTQEVSHRKAEFGTRLTYGLEILKSDGSTEHKSLILCAAGAQLNCLLSCFLALWLLLSSACCPDFRLHIIVRSIHGVCAGSMLVRAIHYQR